MRIFAQENWSSHIWSAFHPLISGEGIQFSIFLCSSFQIVTMKTMYWEDNLPSAWLTISLSNPMIPAGGIPISIARCGNWNSEFTWAAQVHPAANVQVRFSTQTTNARPLKLYPMPEIRGTCGGDVGWEPVSTLNKVHLG